MYNTNNSPTQKSSNDTPNTPQQQGYPPPGYYGYTAYPYSQYPYTQYQHPQNQYPQQTPYPQDRPSQPPHMYSPGIFADLPVPETFEENTSNNNSERKDSESGLFSILRATALVLVCILAGTVSAYAITNYRFERGDFTPVTNHVVLGNNTPSDSDSATSDSSYSTPLTITPDGEMSASDIYDLAVKQVVGINVTTSSGGYFESLTPAVAGSGFIISNDGYLLTNYHVIEMAHARDLPISVVMHDTTEYDAVVVGFDASSDVAVLKIDTSGLNPAYIGESDSLRVGQTVYAVGNPFGDLVYTMTDGIVSALDRVVTVEGKTINTFQFSAAVNSGNSGGPVYNVRGEVIGIVTAKIIRGNVEGIGFAIPIKDAIDIASALIEHGYISGRPLLGITVQPMTQAQADYIDAVVGVYVREVNPGSAAQKAGIEVGDIITAVADVSVQTLDDLRFTLRDWKAGETTTITIWRNGETIDLPITFDEDLNAGKPNTPQPEPSTPDPFEHMP